MSRAVVLGIVAGLVRSAVAGLLVTVGSSEDLRLALDALALQDELEGRGVVPVLAGDPLTAREALEAAAGAVEPLVGERDLYRQILRLLASVAMAEPGAS